MRTTRSRQLFARAQRILPGGVDSPVRAFKSVGASPLFIARAHGARLVDVDGNTFIDYVMSWGPLIHGHAPRGLVATLKAAIGDGTSYGAPSPLEVELGERVRRLMPSLERVRFVNSGTEAAMSAIRVARAATGRERLIKFEGCYHGHADAVPGPGRIGRADAGRADQPGRDARRGRRHARRDLQRSRIGAAAVRRQPRPDCRAHRRADRRQHGRRAARRRLSARTARGVHRAWRLADLRRGDFGFPRRDEAERRRCTASGRI